MPDKTRSWLVVKLLEQLRGTVGEMLFLAKGCALEMAVTTREHLRERRLGIETETPHRLSPDLSQHGDMERHDATPYRIIDKALGYLAMGPEDVLVDLGCGQGRIVLAAASLEIKKVVGVELRKELADVARENLRRCRRLSAPVEIVEADAADWDPREGTVFCVANAFGPATLAGVCDCIRRSLAERPRRVRLVYCIPVHRSVVDAQDWLEFEKEVAYDEVLVWRNRPSPAP